MLKILEIKSVRDSRKVLLEAIFNGEVEHYLVAELPFFEDDCKMKLEYDMQGTILFREKKLAEEAFINYMKED